MQLSFSGIGTSMGNGCKKAAALFSLLLYPRVSSMDSSTTTILTEEKIPVIETRLVLLKFSSKLSDQPQQAAIMIT